MPSLGNYITTLEGHTDAINSVAISIVTGSWDTTAKIWDVVSGNCITTLEEHGQTLENILEKIKRIKHE